MLWRDPDPRRSPFAAMSARLGFDRPISSWIAIAFALGSDSGSAASGDTGAHRDGGGAHLD
jgi:hypothetical protein